MRRLFPACLAIAIAAAQQGSVPFETTVSVPGGSVRYLRPSTAFEGTGPLIVVLPGGNATPQSARELLNQWHAGVGPRGWRTIVPMVFAGYDPGVKALEAILTDAKQSLHADESAVFLAGAGGSASEVFYAASRIPDQFAAAVAIQGNPAQAINTNRIFGANTQALPVLWIDPPPGADLVKQRLIAAGYSLETRTGAKDVDVIAWLSSHKRRTHPETIDCETGSPAFGRCYWVDMTKFDPRKRNDALKSTRVPPGSGASLDLGGFGYDPSAPGPGVLIGWLPENYKGPLRLNDRIVSIAGGEIKDGSDYARYMDDLKEEKPVAVMVDRKGEKVRLETRIVLPKREELVTARVQATYVPEQKEVLLISRAVSEMRVSIPAHWAPVSISWNGNDFKADSGGCWLLSQEKEKPSISACPAPESGQK